MQLSQIVIYHAAAIGDSVLATPVAKRLKQCYPAAKITYFCSWQVAPLLQLCPDIDDIKPLHKTESTFAIRKRIAAEQPDLIIDLSGSSKSWLATSLLGKQQLRYRKEKRFTPPMMHAAQNYLATIRSLCRTEDSLFPTLKPKQEDIDEVVSLLPPQARDLIALVPGVGSLRPHRAWPVAHWQQLIHSLSEVNRQDILLIGGSEERDLLDRIAALTGNKAITLAGKLSLRQTAAALHLAKVTIAGDTGPAHISVAVGTAVIGLYGPTFPERSGPYGYTDLLLSATGQCCCHNQKNCSLANADAPGKCMESIDIQAVQNKLRQLCR